MTGGVASDIMCVVRSNFFIMKRSEMSLMVLQVPVDFSMMFLAALSAYALRFLPAVTAIRPVMFELPLLDYMHLAILVSTGWVVVFAMLGLYIPDQNRKLGEEIVRIMLGASAGLGALAIFLIFTHLEFDSRFLLLFGWIFSIAYVISGRIILRGVKSVLYRSNIGLRRIIVIGNGEMGESIVATLSKRKELGYRVIAHFPRFTKQVEAQIKHIPIDELLFLNPRANEEEALAALECCRQHHIVFKYSADLFATYSANMDVHPLAGMPIVALQPTSLGAWGRVSKRVFDIVFSVLVLVVFSPVMALTALMILSETGTPVIYKNERIGIRGRRFFAYKFRSMYQKDSTGVQFGEHGKMAEVQEKRLIKKNNVRKGPIYKIADDPRVTPFGRFIRRWSIDELPQFWNVLLGDMSVVGPRPHQPREVKQYERDYKQVFTLKPGITGLAQISGRSDLSFDDEMKLDIFYTEKWSLLTDAIICVKTPFILVKKRKAL